MSRVAEVLEGELIRLLKQAQEETGKRRTSILLDLLVNLSNPVETSIRGMRTWSNLPTHSLTHSFIHSCYCDDVCSIATQLAEAQPANVLLSGHGAILP